MQPSGRWHDTLGFPEGHETRLPRGQRRPHHNGCRPWSSTRLVPLGSVLCVVRSGILRHSFPVAVNRREVTLNQDLRAVHPRHDVLPNYLAYFLRRSARPILDACSKDGTTVNSIETDRLLGWRIPLPGVDVQRRIVARIDVLLAEIEEGEQALAEARAGVETYRKALSEGRRHRRTNRRLAPSEQAVISESWSDNLRPRRIVEICDRLSGKRQHFDRKQRKCNLAAVDFSGSKPTPIGWCWVEPWSSYSRIASRPQRLIADDKSLLE